MKFSFLQRLSNIWALSRSIENPSVPLSMAGIMGNPTATGKTVTPENALSFSAVWASMQAIGGDIGSLPIGIYKKDGSNKATALDHKYYNLIHSEPNPQMTAPVFYQGLMTNVLSWGNGYAEIIRKGAIIKQFNLHKSSEITPYRSDKGNIFYKINGTGKEIPARDMIHIPGLSFDGLVGKSPITVARENIGLGLALQEFGNRFFGNGANLNGVLEHPATLSPEARKNVKESWQQTYGGLSKAQSTALLEEGMKYTSISIPPEDAQFLQTRQFSIDDIARIYRIPPHKIGDLTRSTNNNIEQQSIEYVVDTLNNWVVRIEKEFDRKIFNENEKGIYFTKMNLNSLLRGDIKSRGNWYSQGRQWGWFSINDILKLEDMNTIANGDDRLVPLNMTTVEKMKMNGQPSKEEIGKIVIFLKEHNYG